MPATIFGAVILTLGIAVLFAAAQIPRGYGYDVVGPAMLPQIIGGGLIVSALVVLAEVVLKRDEPAVDLSAFDYRPVVLISAALLLEAALISRAGWVPVVTGLFAAGTLAFGDKRAALNLVIGFGVSLVVLVAFRFGLGIDLPLGPLEVLLKTTG